MRKLVLRALRVMTRRVMSTKLIVLLKEQCYSCFITIFKILSKTTTTEEDNPTLVAMNFV